MFCDTNLLDRILSFIARIKIIIMSSHQPQANWTDLIYLIMSYDVNQLFVVATITCISSSFIVVIKINICKISTRPSAFRWLQCLYSYCSWMKERLNSFVLSVCRNMSNNGRNVIDCDRLFQTLEVVKVWNNWSWKCCSPHFG